MSATTRIQQAFDRKPILQNPNSKISPHANFGSLINEEVKTSNLAYKDEKSLMNNSEVWVKESSSNSSTQAKVNDATREERKEVTTGSSKMKSTFKNENTKPSENTKLSEKTPSEESPNSQEFSTETTAATNDSAQELSYITLPFINEADFTINMEAINITADSKNIEALNITADSTLTLLAGNDALASIELNTDSATKTDFIIKNKITATSLQDTNTFKTELTSATTPALSQTTSLESDALSYPLEGQNSIINDKANLTLKNIEDKKIVRISASTENAEELDTTKLEDTDIINLSSPLTPVIIQPQPAASFSIPQTIEAFLGKKEIENSDYKKPTTDIRDLINSSSTIEGGEYTNVKEVVATTQSPLATSPKNKTDTLKHFSNESKLKDLELVSDRNNSQPVEVSNNLSINNFKAPQNIKFVHSANTLNINEPSPSEQISLNIRQAITTAKQVMTVSLSPENLGQVDIRVEISAGTIKDIKIQAHKAETLDAIIRDSFILEQAVRDILKSDVNLSYSYREENSDMGGFAGQNNQAGTEEKAGTKSYTAVTPAVDSSARTNIIDGDTVDVRI